jgi:AraC-like DNA-binding protein
MEPILYITITQFVFAALLVLTKKPRQAADWVLGWWLITMTIFLTLVLFKEQWPQSAWSKLQVYPLGGLLGPFLYLYVRKLVSPHPHLQWTDLWHVLPFVLICVVELSFPLEVDQYFTEGNFLDRGRWTYTAILIVLNLVYLGLALQVLARHRKAIQQVFSYDSSAITLSWLYTVIVIFSLTFVLTLVILLAILVVGPFINPGLPIFLGFAIFAYAISFYGVRQRVIYEDTSPAVAEITDLESPRYIHSSLTEEDAQKHIAHLLAYMEEAHPYRERELTIQTVSEALDIPQHHLTQTLNEFLGKNFYTLVNEYRVAEVQRLLTDPSYDHYSLLGIAYEAGFNSKSAFNATFKKFTGQTPSEYRKEMGASSSSSSR